MPECSCGPDSADGGPFGVNGQRQPPWPLARAVKSIGLGESNISTYEPIADAYDDLIADEDTCAPILLYL